MTPDDMHIRRMTRDELDVLVEWAAREGWNPGLDDAEVFWNTDPDGFVAAQIGGELVGGGSIVAYDKRYCLTCRSTMRVADSASSAVTCVSRDEA